ncbi:MAG: acylphosphatase [Alphaproteobacteria bacterium CG11_big_fil_rev_8_21_14_0_20_39_49]|nr:MAG: acylphosphatase [Alphaproteobacteria bacterium CG11_big_fil_rev_8_21_14_0_20_39_49]
MHDEPGFGSGKPKAQKDIYCLRLVIEGEVQGVGYRNWLKGVCTESKVTGWVKNKSNGSVEAVLYGKQTVVKEIASRCYKGSAMAQVKKVKEYPEEIKSTIPNDFKIASSG